MFDRPWISLARSGVLFFACLIAVSIVSAKKKPPTAPVNLNTADSEQLQLVPGIGPATAEKILQMRKAYGAFKSVDDLLAIHGIGPKRLEKMRKYLTVGKTAGGRPNAETGPVTPASTVKPPPKPVPPKAPEGTADPPCLWM